MTDIEERRAKQRERNRRWRQKHPITDEERAKKEAAAGEILEHAIRIVESDYTFATKLCEN